MSPRLRAALVAVFSVLLVVAVGMAAARPFGSLKLNGNKSNFDAVIATSAERMLEEGRTTFRFDTFGSEAFWGGELRLHEAIMGSALGGVGPGLSPRAALGLGLKVDVEALPPKVVQAIRRGDVNLDDPAVTVELLRHDAVIGVKGIFEGNSLESVGIQCALCHSVVNNSLAPGIGGRLDGWANRDLDIGAIVATAPDLSPFATLLGVDEGTVRTVLRSWGPGKFDAQLVLDGKAFRPDGGSAATLIPPAFGMAGVNLHTSTGWGSVTHWNAFVSNLEMHGTGTFYDPRLDDAATFPIAAREGFGHVRNTPDLITARLPGLHFYQLAIPAPPPPEGSFDRAAAARGDVLFEGKAQCATCHVSPLYTEPGWNMHTPAEIGIDDFQANRSPDKRYRTAPLGGLWTHQKGGFYHDGRFGTLLDVVNHYDGFFGLGLSPAEKNDLVEYLKSLPDDEMSELESGTHGAAGKAAASEFGRTRLDPPFPNPATEQVTIPFSLSRAGEVELSVFDVSGRSVATLKGDRHEPGDHSLTWNARNGEGRHVAPGVYFTRISVDGVPQAERRIVIGR